MRLHDSKAVASFLDISERRVRQLRDKKVIAEVLPGLYDLRDTNHRYINFLRNRNPDSEAAIDYNTERALLMRAKRKSEEYDLLLKEDKLHSSEDIEGVFTDMLINFKTRLNAIPSKLSPVLAKKSDKSAIFNYLKSAMDEALLELSDFETVFEKRLNDERGAEREASDG